MASLHLDILSRLLPPVAYDIGSSAVLAELASAAAVLDSALESIATLSDELDARSTYALLDEFEAAFGLPDACADVDYQTVGDRRLALALRIAARGSQQPAYYEALAESLGYPGARVYEYDPWTCIDSCVEPIATAEWRHVWALQIPGGPRVTYFSATSPCNEPLANWSALEAISCVINRLKPAHTLCYFDFGA
ncbi:MAG: DUF2313 domain-containing protein [Rubrivivax sp.]